MKQIIKSILGHPRRLIAACVMIIAAAGVAAAYEVEPMRIIMDLGSGRTSSVITIRNTRDQDLPVEIVMKRRIVHPDGRQEFVVDEENFSVFPPLALIPAGETQAVRITYIGDPAIEDSQAYVAEVQEVPVQREDFTGVVFAYNFGVALYVRADEARANVSLDAVERTETGIAFSVTNAGTDFAMLGELELSVEAGGQSVSLSPEQVAELVENPIIPPHGSRDFHLAINDLPDGPVNIGLGRAY